MTNKAPARESITIKVPDYVPMHRTFDSSESPLTILIILELFFFT